MRVSIVSTASAVVLFAMLVCATGCSPPAITEQQAIQLIAKAGGSDKVCHEAQEVFKRYPTQTWLEIAPRDLANYPALQVLAEASEDGRITLCRYGESSNLSVFFGKYPNSRYLYLPESPEHSRRTYASSEIEILPDCFLGK